MKGQGNLLNDKFNIRIDIIWILRDYTLTFIETLIFTIQITLKLSLFRFNAPPLYCKILGIWEIYFPTTSTFLVFMLVAVKYDMLKNPFHSLSPSNKWIHVGCILICFAGLIIPSAPFYNLATYIYCPKRMTCTFDFYPNWTNDRPKSIFVTWAVVFCCVVPLLSIATLSYFIIKKVRSSRQATDGKTTSDKKVGIPTGLKVED